MGFFFIVCTKSFEESKILSLVTTCDGYALTRPSEKEQSEDANEKTSHINPLLLSSL